MRRRDFFKIVGLTVLAPLAVVQVVKDELTFDTAIKAEDFPGYISPAEFAKQTQAIKMRRNKLFSGGKGNWDFDVRYPKGYVKKSKG